VAEIVCYIYIFHLTDLHHYTTLLNVDVLNFHLTLDYLTFIIIRLLRFGVKVKRAYCRDNFLLSCLEATARHVHIVPGRVI